MVQVFLTLSIFATLILNAISDEYGPPMPSDDYIEKAAEEYFIKLKQPWASPEDEKLYAGLVGYEISKVHGIAQRSSPRPMVCIINEVFSLDAGKRARMVRKCTETSLWHRLTVSTVQMREIIIGNSLKWV